MAKQTANDEEAGSRDRVKKLELIQRSLGLRHKLKVHESMEPPTSHDDLSYTLLAKWELEDELHAIEELLAEMRRDNVKRKRDLVSSGILEQRRAAKQAQWAAEEEELDTPPTKKSRAKVK
ncbi:MAG TPA: hypothetical protein VL588_06990 [Bdellovibrionota bacterium]|jgi:hypothetical protein|nr:hypothetical protein [Bdellovibrionota bacterium]